MPAQQTDPPIERIEARSYCVPTDFPEADGTFAWDHTTIVVVEVTAGSCSGLGYSYTDDAAVHIVRGVLAKAILQENAFAIPKLWRKMVGAVRNIGWRGVCANAISAVDVALWDLKARLLGIPLVRLFGAARESVAIYGSGGFTSYTDKQIADQLSGWVHKEGCRSVKMKIGSEPWRDPERMRVAKHAIGDANLMIDANGAFMPKQALQMADRAAALGVIWFEEPVSSDDLPGLHFVRERAPAIMDIAAGEYGYDPFYFKHMIGSGAVDVIQADATRCCGYTGFLEAAALADAHPLPLSAHCAPALHLPVCCAAPRLRNLEWFHDHVRIERIFFDGAPVPKDGAIHPDLSRPGHGLDLKRGDAERYAK
jgi:L-alanine-DL-glutamate epimerase-like enolase superfamily enzyme